MKRLALAAMCLGMFGSQLARAEPVPDLIKVIENQPTDMDRSIWKDKRRDAAKKLGQSKDKKAVPELIKLADSETFDIIGEIAIEGLGALGDPSAVPTLQKIANDVSRDKSQRELAKKSLTKLGASADAASPAKAPDKVPEKTLVVVAQPETPADTGAVDAGTGSKLLVAGGSALVGAKPSSDLPALPALSDDTLAAYDRLTFAGGTASFAYDTGRKRIDAAADVAGTWSHRVERDSMAWGTDAGAHLVTGLVNPQGREQIRGAELSIDLDGEVRFYSGAGIYGVGKAAALLQTTYTSDVVSDQQIQQNGNADFKLTTTNADLDIALGAGYGRMLDVGAAIRVRRLARTLEAARALGKPIDAATSKKLQLTWWVLRGERSTYRSLVSTVTILREAGVLLGEPDAGLAYELLNVLRDTQLFARPSGLDLQVAFGEGYLRRPRGLIDSGYENGRVEQLLVRAGYGTQLDDDKLEVAGTAYARYRLFAADGQPSPYAAGATAHMTRYTYGDHGDPFGMFDVTGILQVSSDDTMNTDKGLRVEGQLGFTMLFNQASGLRLAADVAETGGIVFLGANLSATYGLLDAVFSR